MPNRAKIPDQMNIKKVIDGIWAQTAVGIADFISTTPSFQV